MASPQPQRGNSAVKPINGYESNIRHATAQSKSKHVHDHVSMSVNPPERPFRSYSRQENRVEGSTADVKGYPGVEHKGNTDVLVKVDLLVGQTVRQLDSRRNSRTCNINLTNNY